MREVNCNIIKDLMVTYIDNVCSDESRELIEHHITTCNNCKSFLESISTTENSTQVSEVKQLKKISTTLKICLLMVFLAPFIVSVITFIEIRNNVADGILPVQFFYLIAMPVIMLCFSFTFSDYHKLNSEKIKIPAVVSIVAFIVINILVVSILVLKEKFTFQYTKQCCYIIVFCEMFSLFMYAITEKDEKSFLLQSIAWLGVNQSMMLYSVLSFMVDLKTCFLRLIFGHFLLIIEFFLINFFSRKIKIIHM